jgi:PleD family two-component response regulator
VALEHGSASVTVSIGISRVTDPTVSAETAIREADAAMYRAKAQGDRDHYARSANPAPLTVRISGGEPSLRRSRVT